MLRASLKSCWVDVAFLASLAVFILGIRVTEPAVPYFDEFFYVPSARAIYLGEGATEVTHPPLGKLAMAVSIGVFGDEPLGWRLPSLLSGILIPALVYALVRSCGGTRFVAVMAGALVVMDGLCITQARAGLLNSPSLALGLAALVCAFRRWIVVSAAFLAMSVATKYSGLAFLPLLVLVGLHIRKERPQDATSAGELIVAALVAGGVYVISFYSVPRGADVSFLSVMWKHHVAMFEHHMTAVEPHRYQSEWWTWPLSMRPIWYGFERIPNSELVRGILCIANPMTSLVVLIGALVVTARLVAGVRLTVGESVALGGYLLSFFPWALSPRLTMYHYYYPALVFGVVLFALQVDKLATRIKLMGGGVVFLASLILFIYWYPLWTASPISSQRYESMVWFDSWR